MKTKGALLYEPGTDWKVEEIDVGDPVAGEVRVRLAASGLCHSDEHVRTGANTVRSTPCSAGTRAPGSSRTSGRA